MATIISVDGNIGSGKSTFIKMCPNINNVIFVQEPVDEWELIREESTNKSILAKFYEDQNKYSFSFQMMAYISRLSKIRNIIKKNPKSIIVTERSIYTDKEIFAKMLFDSGKMEEINYKIYLKWFDEFIEDFPLHTIIYIDTLPSDCYANITKRNREGETIPLEYLISCDIYHKEFINKYSKQNIKIIKVSSNFTQSDVYDTIINLIVD